MLSLDLCATTSRQRISKANAKAKSFTRVFKAQLINKPSARSGRDKPFGLVVLEFAVASVSPPDPHHRKRP